MNDVPPNDGPLDRSSWPVRIGKLHDEVDEVGDYAHFTPGHRIDLVDELTRAAWSLRNGSDTIPEFQREVVRVLRGADRWVRKQS